jgi:bifunctional non-homologous end joining protein LigD
MGAWRKSPRTSLHYWAGMQIGESGRRGRLNNSLSLRPLIARVLHPIVMRPPRFDTAQLSLVRTPFDDPNFLFELKHDGFRALAHIWDGNCELVSRKRNVYKSFNELRENLAKLK